MSYVFLQCMSTKEGFDPYSASITVIGDFLLHVFHSGLQINTVWCYRSAITVVHHGFDNGSSLFHNTAISQLIKGMFLERPPIKKLTPSWDLITVLHRLTKAPFEPAGFSSLHNLTVKTVFLLVASTTRRRSELHALSIEPGHLPWEHGGVRLFPCINLLTKNQSQSFSPPDIFVPSLTSSSSVTEDKLWCPVRILKFYTARTKELHGNTTQLFITTLQASTISWWIVKAILPANNSPSSTAQPWGWQPGPTVQPDEGKDRESECLCCVQNV